ncbi:MAG TPA: universal stress protein [Candidatus Dormibacteraeota bacterium]|nr:universal stress protein [Candidatus Dormibacteraeota bacterium]
MDAGDRGIGTIVVGLDGSDHAAAALTGTIGLAVRMDAEVVAVHAVGAPADAGSPAGERSGRHPADWRTDLARRFVEDWCRPLREARVRHVSLLEDGRPAALIAAVADRVDAGLVVVGRRGRGHVSELLLGSVSHELSQRCRRPVVLVTPRHDLPAPASASDGRAGALAAYPGNILSHPAGESMDSYR